MEAFESVSDQHLSANRPKPTFAQKLVMVLRVLLSTAMTVCITFLSTIARLGLPFLGRRLYRRISDFLLHAWFETAFFLLDRTRLHLYGSHKSLHSLEDDTRPRIVISNHATDVDWIFLWMIAHTCEVPRTGHVRVMLKEGVKKVPLYGQLMDNLDFLWMKRNWDSDRDAIKQMMSKLCTDGEPFWVLIFPEGMTVNTKSMQKANEFAEKENRPRLEMTLLPREKGFSALLECTKELNPEIVDITMAFESFTGEIPTWEMGYERNNDHLVPNAKKLMYGMSGSVFADVRTFDVGEVLAHPGGVKAWLDERWVRKDKYLKHFARHEAFPDEEGQIEVKIPQGSLSRLGVVVLVDSMLIYGFGRFVQHVASRVKSIGF